MENFIKIKNWFQSHVSCFKLHATRSRGFTLVELMVVIFFSTGIMTLLLASHRKAAYAGAMERASIRVAQDIRAAQSMALSTENSRLGNILPPCGFGVHAPNPATNAPDSYIIYTKVVSSTSVPCGVVAKQWAGGKQCFDPANNYAELACTPTWPHFVSTSTVRAFVLPEGGRVQFKPLTVLDDIYFEPPDPTTTILHYDGPVLGTYSTSLVANFELQLSENTAQTRTVNVWNSGRVEISGSQKLSAACIPNTCSTLDLSYTYICGTWPDGCGGSVTCAPGCIPGDLCCDGTDPCPTPLGMCYPVPPTAPTNVVATPVSGSFKINLTWTDTAISETFFDIERLGPNCTGTPVSFPAMSGNGLTTGPMPNPAFTDSTGLTAETTYCYRVKARNMTGSSAWVNSNDALTVPASPFSINVRNFNGYTYRMTVQWDPSCSNAFPNCWYRIERCLGSSCTDFSALNPLDKDATTPYCDTNRTPLENTTCNPTPPANPGPFDPAPPGIYTVPESNLYVFPNSLYRYRVVAVNASGDSPAPLEGENTTKDIVPSVPSGFNAVAAGAPLAINVTWTDDRDYIYGRESSFRLFRCNGNCDPLTDSVPDIIPVSPGNNISGPATLTYNDTSVTSDSNYTYCIKAVNGSVGESNCSAFLPASTLPNPPTLLAATSTGIWDANIQWTDNSSIETENEIIRGPTGGSCVSNNWTPTPLGVFSGGTRWSPAVLPAAETLYCIKVRAIGASGVSTSTNGIVIKTWLPTPGNFTVQALSGSQVRLDWTATPPNSETGFKIERCQGTNCTLNGVNQQVATVLGGVAQYLDNGRSQSTTYCYRIRATSPEVDSDYTSKICVTTPVQGQYNESGGFVIFEAEQFLISSGALGGHDWSGPVADGTASNGQYMEATPNDNTNPAWNGSTPRLDYNITFSTAGPYYVWVRGAGLGSQDRTVHAGLNSSGTNSDCIRAFGATWGWQGGVGGRKSGCTGGALNATVSPTVGPIQTFNLWMSDSGFRADRILLVNNSAYTPNPPVVTINASALSGASSTLTWSITNPTLKNCLATASPPNADWSGAKATSGSQVVNNITGVTTFTLTCTGPAGEWDDGTVTVSPFDFTVDGSPPADVTVSAGGSGSNITTVTLLSGNAQAVTLSYSTLPSGASATWVTSNNCTPNCTRTLNITTTGAIAPGTYPITITGTAGALVHTTVFNLIVTSFDFTLSGTPPANISVNQGSSGTNTTTATLVTGPTQSVAFTVSGLPVGATATFPSGTSCSPNCTRSLQISVAAGTPAGGPYTITVQGSGGSITRTTTFSLTVVAVTFPVRMNFQPAAAAIPSGYQADDGTAFTTAKGYGWNVDNSGNTRDRDLNADQRLDTFVYSPSAVYTWNFTIPNGTYYISLASGDAGWAQGPHRVVVEGVTAINNVSTAVNIYRTVNDLPITVSDGSLTIAIGGGGGSTMINYLIISQTPAPAPSLIAHLKFDDGSGTNAADSSGSNNPGTLVSTPTWTMGRDNGALDFNGTSNYVRINDSPTLDTNHITVSAWVYKQANPTNWGMIASRQEGTGCGDLWLLHYNNSVNDEYRWNIQTTGGAASVTGPASTGDLNTWVHLVGTYNGSAVTLYKNGAQVATASHTGNLLIESTGVFVAAGDNGSCASIAEFIDAKVDDVRIYNGGLSAAEVAALYASYPPPPLGPIAHWKFDDGAGTSAIDSSGSGYTGSLTNMESMDWVSGRDGGALSFDGVNEYVSAPSLAMANTSFTVAAWINPASSPPASQTYFGAHTAATTDQSIHLRVSSSGAHRFGFYSDDLDAAGAVTFSTWNYVVVTYDATGDVSRTYINGSQVASGANGPFTGVSPIVAIGSWYSGAPEYFKGLIDDVRVYNRSLSTAEVLSLYTSFPALPSGPNAHWKFDEASGATSFTDSSGNGNTGSCSGATCPVAGVSGRDGFSTSYDGADDYIDFGDTTTLRFGTGNFTITSWIRPTTFDGADAANSLRFLQKNNFPNKWWVIDFNDPDNDNLANIEFESTDDAGNTGTTQSTGEILPLNAWSHFAIVIDRTNLQASYYINGTLDSTKAIPIAFTGTLDVVGSPVRTATYNYFKGGIDDTRVYKRALNTSEISALYTSYPAQTSAMVAHLKLDESSGTTFADSSGNGNGGSCISGTCPTPGVAGRDSLAVDFDGSVDYISVADSNSTDFGTSDFSAAAWFKRANDSTYGMIITDGETAGALNPEFWELRLNTDGTLYFDTESNNAPTAVNTTGTNYADNTWHHAVVVRTGTTLLIYVDGVQRASLSGTLRDVSNTEPLTIGIAKLNGTFTRNPMSGFIDDVRLYNYALSSAQVTTLYTSFPPAPLAAYAMNESSGSMTADATGNGFTGSLINGVARIAGKVGYGNALQFNATDNGNDNDDPRVVIGTSFDVPSLPLTIMAWVNPTNYTDWRAIFSKRDSIVGSNMRFDVGLRSGSGAVYIVSSTCCSYFTYAPPTGTWTHLAVVATSSGLSLYVNGVFSQTLAAITLGSDANANTVIGGTGEATGGDNDPFNGSLDEVRVYNTALTATEITTAMNSPLP